MSELCLRLWRKRMRSSYCQCSISAWWTWFVPLTRDAPLIVRCNVNMQSLAAGRSCLPWSADRCWSSRRVSFSRPLPRKCGSRSGSSYCRACIWTPWLRPCPCCPSPRRWLDGCSPSARTVASLASRAARLSLTARLLAFVLTARGAVSHVYTLFYLEISWSLFIADSAERQRAPSDASSSAVRAARRTVTIPKRLV